MIHVFDLYAAQDFFPLEDTIAIRCIGLPVFWGGKYQPLNPRLYKGILQLIFDDIDPIQDGPSWNDKHYTLFNERHAEDIVNFLNIQRGRFKDIMVHCHAGLSRSVAVAAAIGDCFGFEYDREIWSRREDKLPNMLVYNTIRDFVKRREFPIARKNLS